MATFTLDENNATYQIRAYQPGFIQINEKKYTRSVIIAPEQLIDNWLPQTPQEINFASLAPIIELHPDILLIGTGSQLIFLAVEIYGELLNLGIGVEVMNTASACHTYNALTSENRRICAALILS